MSAGELSSNVNIVYYTDPLCCWSWAMERHWKKLQATYEGLLNMRYCMGGLLPDWNHFHDAVHQVSRPIQMGPVWMEAAHLTNTEINSKLWFDNPPASSYLACIAVKCAGIQSKKAEDQYLYLLRKAVMTQLRDISHASELIHIAEEMAPGQQEFSMAQFEDDLYNGRGMEAFRKDLAEVRELGIQRFPTLVFKSESHPPLLITGYRDYEVLAGVIKNMSSRRDPRCQVAGPVPSEQKLIVKFKE